MPNFRWSDNSSKATVFVAKREEFSDKAIDALIDLRNQTCQSIHRGDYHAQWQYCPALELHLFDGDHFVRLGYLMDTDFGPKTAWVPDPFFVPAVSKWVTRPKKGTWPGAGSWPPYEPPLHDDALYVRENLDVIWDSVKTTLAWTRGLRGLASDLTEEIFPVE